MRSSFLVFITLFGLGISLQASATLQESKEQKQMRRVKGKVLTSTEMPAVRLEFDKGFTYVGSQNFILYDVARAEQHFFVDADKQKRIKRMYWVQFEGYLPGNTHTYRYKVNKSVNIGGLEFIADSYSRNIKTSSGRPDSDGNRARAFLESKGYHMASDEILSQRFVYMADEAKRNELMIIYMEDLSGTGLTAADLASNGSAASRWNEVSAGLLDRAMKGMKVVR
ncbi:MAG: hypothetical protein WBV94_31600 [Blastocatellia bacterium]